MGKIEIESGESDNEIELEGKPSKKQQSTQKTKQAKSGKAEGPAKIKKSKTIQKEKVKNAQNNANDLKKKGTNKQPGPSAETALKNPELFKKFLSKIEQNPNLNHLLQDVRGKSTDSSSKQPLSRGQRKRTEAKKKVAKRNLFNEFLEKTKATKGETEIDLEALKYDLEDIEKQAQINSKKAGKKEKQLDITKGVSNKNKLHTSNTDIKHMQAVLQLKPFLDNPLQALREHIQNTIASKNQKS